jgi:hypothetical protein
MTRNNILNRSDPVWKRKGIFLTMVIPFVILIHTLLFVNLPIACAQDFTHPNIRVDHDTGDASSILPSIAVDDDGNFDGITWSQEVMVDPDHWSCGEPSIATDGVNVYIVWTGGIGESDIYFDMSPVDNIGFNDTDIRVNNEINGGQQKPQIATDGTNVYIVWQDNKDGNEDIYFDYSPVNSINFGGVDKKVNSDAGSEEQWHPSIATDGINVYIAWDDQRSGNNEDVYFDYSPVSSLDFSGDDFKVSDGPSYSINWKADITIDSTNIYIAWEDDRDGNVNIYFDSSSIS